jgi:hypothetical protein
VRHQAAAWIPSALDHSQPRDRSATRLLPDSWSATQAGEPLYEGEFLPGAEAVEGLQEGDHGEPRHQRLPDKSSYDNSTADSDW